MYFHTDDDTTIMYLSFALSTAMHDGRTVRFDVDAAGNLRYKIGEGAWTAPIASTPDPYRDGT